MSRPQVVLGERKIITTNIVKSRLIYPSGRRKKMSKKSLFKKTCLMDILQLLPGAKGKRSCSHDFGTANRLSFSVLST